MSERVKVQANMVPLTLTNVMWVKVPLDVIKKDASQISGSKTCDISLLLKYKLAINDINTYTDIKIL